MDPRHAPDQGDIKYVWELNRLQYLQPIAALAALDGDADLARFCRDEIESWIGANPPFRGVAWKSGIELGLRVVSLLVVVTLLGDAGFTRGQRRHIWATLAAHGAWLARFPSRFSSANNHLVAEATGLFLLGATAPALPHSADHADYGRRTLEAEAPRQILAHGVGAQQSPTYAALSLECLLGTAAVGHHLGRPFS